MADNGNFWQGLMTQLNESSNANFIFPKDGKTRVRLLGVGENTNFFREVQTVFQNRVRTKFLVLGFSAPEGDDEPVLKGIILTKTAFKSIVGMQAEGYDFFSPDDGHGLAIIRSGTGRDTNYTVVPSPKPLGVPEAIKEVLTPTLIDEYVEKWVEYQASRTNNNQQRSGGSQQGTGANLFADGDDSDDDW